MTDNERYGGQSRQWWDTSTSQMRRVYIHDALQDAFRRIDKMEKHQCCDERWRKVEEELPEEGVLVLAHNTDVKDTFTAKRINAIWIDDGPREVYVTHWQPLPEGPEE